MLLNQVENQLAQRGGPQASRMTITNEPEIAVLATQHLLMQVLLVAG